MRQEEVLAGLMRHARPRILKTFRPDSCVATVRIVTLVAENLGVKLTPTLVKVRVLNPTFAKLSQENQGGPQTHEQAKEWLAKGAWEVALGYGQDPDPFLVRKKDGLDGHLVALTGDGQLLDLSLDQANRPHANIHVGPILTRLTKAWPRGHVVNVGECVVLYAPLEGDRQKWEGGPDWKDSTRWAGIVAELTERISEGA